MFSILILTKNEEINMRDCMESVSWCDDVVVLDSLSDDDTCEMAEDMGARVFERPFDDFGAQRNYALDEIEFRHPWVFHLDADERFNEELRAECERVIERGCSQCLFRAEQNHLSGEVDQALHPVSLPAGPSIEDR